MAKKTVKRLLVPAPQRRYVAFLDVLGFKHLVYRADTELDARRTIQRAITILRGANNTRTNSGYKFTHFSDSIVLSADLTSIGARAMMESCTRLSVALLERGLLLRGGMTVGNVVHTERTLYGSAMIEAYLLDQRGLPPRISITNAAITTLENQCTPGFIARYVETDGYDLSPMVHTLQDFARLGRRGAQPDGSRIATGNRIASRISVESDAMSSDAEVRAKWRWLRDYWNRSMNRYGVISQS
jgi:hypothetical protein